MEDDVEDNIPGFDILQWWKLKSVKYNALVHMARDILAILNWLKTQEKTLDLKQELEEPEKLELELSWLGVRLVVLSELWMDHVWATTWPKRGLVLELGRLGELEVHHVWGTPRRGTNVVLEKLTKSNRLQFNWFGSHLTSNPNQPGPGAPLAQTPQWHLGVAQSISCPTFVTKKPCVSEDERSPLPPPTLCLEVDEPSSLSISKQGCIKKKKTSFGGVGVLIPISSVRVRREWRYKVVLLEARFGMNTLAPLRPAKAPFLSTYSISITL
ncbi:hypothetical protein PIB30_082113 [Stylosanthes scabra]|uniref:HAT C-terminal dimerisation domain-containing protein n=1 Tax=Stylosanthes scabra TaxID=79078 RepID=A0ABU6TTV1_9FABA|nr:hypothetical protein [Stylosanthes scabra]